MTSTHTVNTIRHYYQHPVSPLDKRTGDLAYCIGGAVCMYSIGHVTGGIVDNRYHRFPHAFDVAKALVVLNPTLPYALAEEWAKEIIATNDRREFEKAWYGVEFCLKYTNPCQGCTTCT